MVTLNKDAPCGKYSLNYCRFVCDWINCRFISDETRYKYARIGEGIEKQS